MYEWIKDNNPMYHLTLFLNFAISYQLIFLTGSFVLSIVHSAEDKSGHTLKKITNNISSLWLHFYFKKKQKKTCSQSGFFWDGMICKAPALHDPFNTFSYFWTCSWTISYGKPYRSELNLVSVNTERQILATGQSYRQMWWTTKRTLRDSVQGRV